MTRKIGILGTTPSRMQAPFDDESWTFWTIGPGGKDSNRWDMLFEIHGWWPEDFAEYLNDLSKVAPPQSVLTMDPLPEKIDAWALQHDPDGSKGLRAKVTGDFAGNIVYPKQEMVGKYGRMWFSSSISWCIARALEELSEGDELGLWGIDLEAGEEYVAQFIGCRHFLDIARFRGIKVTLPDGCGLDRDPTCYPDRYETHFALMTEKKVKHLSALIGQMQAEHEVVTAEMHHREANVDDLQRWLPQVRGLGGNAQVVADMEDELEAARQKLAERRFRQQELTTNIHTARGELNSINYMRSLYVIGITDPNA